MIDCEPFEISSEVYNRAINNRGYITSEDKNNLFDTWQLCGYGVYGARAYEENGKYWCAYSMGSTCD